MLRPIFHPRNISYVFYLFTLKKRRRRHIIISAITYIKCSCGTCVCINPYRSRSQHAHGWMRDEYRCLFWIVRDGDGIRINSNNTDWMEGFPFTILSRYWWWWWSGRDPHQDSAPPEVILEEDPQCRFSPSTTAVWQVKHDWHHMRLVKRNKMKGSHEETKKKVSVVVRAQLLVRSFFFVFKDFLCRLPNNRYRRACTVSDPSHWHRKNH